MKRHVAWIIGVAGLVVLNSLAGAHITPPVVLVSDRDAVLTLLGVARRFFVREIRLSPEQRQAIQHQWNWTPDEDFYRFYVGRDEQGRLVAVTIFLTEFTLHGPVRVAVALSPDGKVKGATVVELTEETYPWVKPLIDRNFIGEYVGQGSSGRYALAERSDSMTQFYGQIIASLIQRAAILYEVAMGRQGGAT
jgi:hypothetical protein